MSRISESKAMDNRDRPRDPGLWETFRCAAPADPARSCNLFCAAYSNTLQTAPRIP